MKNWQEKLEALYSWLESFRAKDEEWLDEVVKDMDQINAETEHDEELHSEDSLFKKALSYMTGVCMLVAVCLCAGLFVILVMVSLIPIIVRIIVRRFVQRGVKHAMRKLQGNCS